MAAKKERNSNLELLRIFAMLLIIMHHYVVNSGVTECYNMDNITINMVFLQLWGMWGKTAINVFILITGYFMSTLNFSWKRFIRIYLQVKFYKITIFIILAIVGYQAVTAEEVYKAICENVFTANAGFIGSFLMFYLFIPFYNILIKSLNQKQFQILIGTLVFMFTITSTFFFNKFIFHEVGWYMTIYFVAAYIRFYPSWWTESKKAATYVLCGTVLLSWLSVLTVDAVGNKVGFSSYYWMVSDSNKLFALIVGVATFLLFKNLRIKQNL